MVISSAISNSLNKEIAIRKRIYNIFNKREEDFPSLREYNDYLEEVEDMTFKLIEGIDVAAIEEKIAKYEEENAEQIIISRAQKAEEMARALREHEAPAVADGFADMAIDQSSQAFGPPGTGQYAPAMAPGLYMQPRPTGPAGQPLAMIGNSNYLDDEESQRQHAERSVRAGGWTPELCKRRAFEEAFSSLWV